MGIAIREVASCDLASVCGGVGVKTMDELRAVASSKHLGREATSSFIDGYILGAGDVQHSLGY
jgi:hypothetical protein